MITRTLLILLIILLFYMYIKYHTLKAKLQIHLESMDLILSNIGDGIVIANTSDEVIKANSIVKSILGIGSTDLKSLSYGSLVKIIREKINESNKTEENFPSIYGCSEHGCTNCSQFILKNKDEDTSTKITIFRNLSECSTAHQIIHRMAHYDSLTGLANRNHIKEILAKSVASAEKNKSLTAVAFIDLDNFKTINDTLGHDLGDMVLKHSSSIIRECLGSKAYAGRLGGDEFVVVMPDISNPLNSLRKMRELLKRLNAPINIDGKEIAVTASVGIALYPLHGRDPQTLLKKADIAMYNAKDKGKKACLLYREEMNLENTKKYEMLNDLKKALDNNEFKLYYQPKVNIINNETVGLEALIRWFHPVKGIIPPSDFIPLAEETGLILTIGEWVLKEACRQNKAWQELGYTPVKVAVNLSTQQFEHKSLVNMIGKIIRETRLDPKWLELEITESIALTCFDCALSKLKELKKIGITVAIDDFGTGYSSFNYLRLLPVDTFKIDKIFLDNLISHPNEQLITAAMIDLGKRLNLSVVAEGVESADQVTFLKEHHCKLAQGYLFSKPVPAEEIKQLLKMI